MDPFFSPAAISFFISLDKVRALPRKQNVPAQSRSYLRPPFDTIQQPLSSEILHFNWHKPYNSAASDSRSALSDSPI